jgi:phage-related protein
MKKRVDEIRSLRGGLEPPMLSFLDFLDAEPGTQQQQQQQRQQQPVDALFLSLVKRIEGVWSELRMPKTDMAFYRKTLLRLGPSGASEKQVREMGRYLNQLQTHRLATIKALKSVAAREEAVAALRTTLWRVEAAEHAGQLRGGGAGSAPQNQYSRLDLLGNSSSRNVLSELAQAVRRVQAASLDVIRRGQKCLWLRPRCLVWGELLF